MPARRTWRRLVHVQYCQLGALQRGHAKVVLTNATTAIQIIRLSSVYSGYGEIKATPSIMDETKERKKHKQTLV